MTGKFLLKLMDMIYLLTNKKLVFKNYFYPKVAKIVFRSLEIIVIFVY